MQTPLLVHIATSPLHIHSNLLPLLLLLSPNQFLDETHRPLLLQSRPFLLLSNTVPPRLPLTLRFRIDAIMSVAMFVHGSMLVEADGFEALGCVSEFV